MCHSSSNNGASPSSTPRRGRRNSIHLPKAAQRSTVGYGGRFRGEDERAILMRAGRRRETIAEATSVVDHDTRAEEGRRQRGWCCARPSLVLAVDAGGSLPCGLRRGAHSPIA